MLKGRKLYIQFRARMCLPPINVIMTEHITSCTWKYSWTVYELITCFVTNKGIPWPSQWRCSHAEESFPGLDPTQQPHQSRVLLYWSKETPYLTRGVEHRTSKISIIFLFGLRSILWKQVHNCRIEWVAGEGCRCTMFVHKTRESTIISLHTIRQKNNLTYVNQITFYSLHMLLLNYRFWQLFTLAICFGSLNRLLFVHLIVIPGNIPQLGLD